MNYNNLKYSLANAYVSNFINVLIKDTKALGLNDINQKMIKDIYKKTLKFDDTSYLNELFKKDHQDSLIKFINNQRLNNKLDESNLIKALDSLYLEEFKNKEILDVTSIKNKVKYFQNLCRTQLFSLYIEDVSYLISFQNDINNELSIYNLKHKSDEYMDMNEFDKNIVSLIDKCKEVINEISKHRDISDEEYLDLFYKFLLNQYAIIFENKKSKTHSIPEWGKGLLFSLPWILGFAVFTLYPIIMTLVFSFSTVDINAEGGFEIVGAGFTNYINIFTQNEEFYELITDYIVSIVIYVPLITCFSLMIALLLNTKVKGTGLFRTIFFLPVIITSGPVMKILIDNGVASIPGLENIVNLEEITAEMPYFMKTAIEIITNDFIMILWFCGIQILVFLTALQKIDKGVYEAANIDGASRWERFWKVTLPAINSTVVINVVFTIVMQSVFALNPVIEHIQELSQKGDYGYLSALSFVYFIVMIVLLVIFVLIFKRHTKRSKKERVNHGK